MPTAMGEKEQEEIVTVTVTPLEESDRRITWGNDVAREKGAGSSSSWTWGLRLGWASFQRTTERVANVAMSLEPTAKLNAACEFVRDFPAVKYFFSKKQWFGLLLLSTGGVSPLVLLGYFTPGRGWFKGVFQSKILWCGNNYLGEPQNSVVAGIEGLFVLDTTYGQLSFSRAKTIDVAWDILIGRGVQILAWWVTYVVFSDALLRVIERHATSFEVFQRVALEGATLHSLWTLFKELWTVRSKRTKALFCYMLLATSYVLCIPMFLGAMTGYDSQTSAWIDLDGTDNMIPTDSLRSGWVVWGNGSLLFDQAKCTDGDHFSTFVTQFTNQVHNCKSWTAPHDTGRLTGGKGDCKMPDGRILPADRNYYYYYDFDGPVKADNRKLCE
jgi:hypothetical protein